MIVLPRLSAAALCALVITGCSSVVAGNPVGGTDVTSPSSPGASAETPSPSGTDPYQRTVGVDIQGLVHHDEPDHTHVQGTIAYDTSPPTGGNHSQYWADCNGAVYPNAIANENAVHSLEHGAVWITYNQDTVSGSDLATLTSLVAGHDYTMLSPYASLKSAVSLQFWGYQLFVDSADDPRIEQFLDYFRDNPDVVPEYGASCSQPSFLAHPSTFGHPLWVPAS